MKEIQKKQAEWIKQFKKKSDQKAIKGQIVTTIIKSLEHITEEKKRTALMNNLENLKDRDLTLSPKIKTAFLEIIKKETIQVKSDLADIKEMKKAFRNVSKQLETFKKEIQYFDEKKGFFWKGKNTNLHLLDKNKKTLESLDFEDYIPYIRKLEKHFAVNKYILSYLESLSTIWKTRSILIGKRLGSLQENYEKGNLNINTLQFYRNRYISFQEIREILQKTDLAKMLNRFFRTILVSIENIQNVANHIRESIDYLYNNLKKEIVTLSRELSKVRRAKTLKYPNIKEGDLRKFRVLLLTHEYEIGGGVATAVRKVVSAIAKRENLQVDVIVHPPPMNYRKNDKPYIFYYKGKYPQTFSTLNELLLFLQDLSYNIIHVHSLSFTDLLKGGLSNIQKLNPESKLIYTCHSLIAYERFSQDKYRPWGTVEIEAQEELLQKADSIVHLTNFGATIAHGTWKEIKSTLDKKMNSYYPQYRKKACIIPNAIDLNFDFFGYSRKYLKWKIKHNQVIRLGYIGRLAEEKGIISLAKVFSRTSQIYEKFYLIIVGDDPGDTGIRNRMEYYLKSTKHLFLGFRDGKELDNAFKHIDICIVPSYNESFSIVALEAFARNIPVIISNVDGPKELFVQGKTNEMNKHKFAIGMDPKNEDSIIQALAYCIGNPAQLEKMVGLAREEIMDKYNWENIAKEYEKLYVATYQDKVYDGGFRPPEEEIEPFDEGIKNGKNVGLIYDMGLWDVFIHMIEYAGYEVNLWAYDIQTEKGYSPEGLASFIQNQDIILICWLASDKWWNEIISLCSKYDKPCIMKYENGLGMHQDNIQKSEQKEALRKATILAPTDLLSSRILKKIGVPFERQIIVPNGIDIKEMEKRSLNIEENRFRFELPRDRVIGAFLGRMDIPKNFLSALIAYKRLAQSMDLSHTCLLFKGFIVDEVIPSCYLPVRHGRLEEIFLREVRDFIKEYGGKIVQQNGKVESYQGRYGKDTLIVILEKGMSNQENYWSFMASCDFILMPSGWGIGNVRVVAEAMALKKPVVMLDAITHPFTYGKAGIYIPAAKKISEYEGLPLYVPDIKQFTAILRKMFLDQDYRNDKGQEGYKYATKNLDTLNIGIDRLVYAIDILKETYDSQHNTFNTSEIKKMYYETEKAMSPPHEIFSSYLEIVEDEKIQEKVDIIIPAFNLSSDEIYYNEAIYCIMTLLYQYRGDSSFRKEVSIFIGTNQPEYFRLFERIPNIHVKHYSRDKLSEWTRTVKHPGKSYIYFIKIMMLKDLARGNNTLLMDTDIIFNHKITKLLNSFRQDISFMNEREWQLKSNMSHYMDFVRSFNNPHIINGETYMWNSGFIGIHYTNLGLIDEIIDLLKAFVEVKYSLFEKYLQIYPPEKYGRPYDNHRTVEQLAVAVVLSKHTVIKQTWDLYFHYYNHKEKIHPVIVKYVKAVKNHGVQKVLTNKEFAHIFSVKISD